MGFNEEKHRRMEIRKSNGTRIVQPPAPRQKGPEYLIAHACFDCDKSFKRVVADEDHKHICPQCSTELYWMGRNFRPPKHADKKQWLKVKVLYAEGFRFVGSGSPNSVPLPEKYIDLERFLKDNPTHRLRVAPPNKELKADVLKHAV